MGFSWINRARRITLPAEELSASVSSTPVISLYQTESVSCLKVLQQVNNSSYSLYVSIQEERPRELSMMSTGLQASCGRVLARLLLFVWQEKEQIDLIALFRRSTTLSFRISHRSFQLKAGVSPFRIEYNRRPSVCVNRASHEDTGDGPRFCFNLFHLPRTSANRTITTIISVLSEISSYQHTAYHYILNFSRNLILLYWLLSKIFLALISSENPALRVEHPSDLPSSESENISSLSLQRKNKEDGNNQIQKGQGNPAIFQSKAC